MEIFDRWTSPWARTWPFALFKRHHTELNDIYWAGNISTHSSERTVQFCKLPKSDQISSALQVRPSQAKRMNFSIAEWEVQIGNFSNWTRLGGLMSLSSYFETYLASACQLAVLSNPGVLLGSSKTIDGIALIKSLSNSDEKSHILRVKEEVKGITKGEWKNRIRTYERFFGKASPDFSSSISILDDMRKMRNGVGHTFGRLMPEYEDPLVFIPKSIQRLSEQRLQNWLGVIEKSTLAIDHQLRSHIGSFEALWKYHLIELPTTGNRTEAQLLRKVFPDAQGSPPGKIYFQDVIKYYKSLPAHS